jgi:hypothetical protein
MDSLAYKAIQTALPSDFEGFSLFEFSEGSDYKDSLGARILLFILNVFLTPFLLVSRSIVVYVLPCIGIVYSV